MEYSDSIPDAKTAFTYTNYIFHRDQAAKCINWAANDSPYLKKISKSDLNAHYADNTFKQKQHYPCGVVPLSKKISVPFTGYRLKQKHVCLNPWSNGSKEEMLSF